MTTADLHTLIDYHYWARDRVLDAVASLPSDRLTRDMGNSFKSIAETLSHMYFAEWIWHERWNGRSPSGPPREPFADIAPLREAWSALETEVRTVVGRLSDADLDRTIAFKMMSGADESATFGEMIPHLVNHGSYHRGQVTTMLRQLGAPPPKSVDLIRYFREKRQG
ncbi:MAG: DinB family protein [Betaproteobacteria bacterium]